MGGVSSCFFQSLKIAMAAMAGGRGGMIPWAWCGRDGNSSQSRESRQKAAIFYQKKSKKLFFSSFLSLNFTSFFWPEHLTLWKKFTLFFRTFFLSFFFFGLLGLHFSIGLKSLFFLSRMDIVLNRSVHKIFFEMKIRYIFCNF